MKIKTLVRIRISLYTIWAICGSWTTAMAGVTWKEMGWEEQSCLVAGMILSWSATMMAFFDKSIWKADEEKKQEKTNEENKTDSTTK